MLKWLAEVSRLNLDWQEMPSGGLNLVTQRSYTPEEARDVINMQLLERGYTLLRNGEVLTMTAVAKIDPSRVPRGPPRRLSQHRPHEFVKASFKLSGCWRAKPPLNSSRC